MTLRVIDDEDIAGAQEVRQVADGPILEPRLAPDAHLAGVRGNGVHHEHPRGVARRCRPQRDALGRKVEVEEVSAHDIKTVIPARAERANPVEASRVPASVASLRGGPRLSAEEYAQLRRHLGADDLVRIAHRLAALDLVDVVHAFDHVAPGGVLVVEECRVVEADEELAVAAVRICARAIDTVPRTCGSLLNSAFSFWPEPPVPVPCGQPVCAMKPSITR